MSKDDQIALREDASVGRPIEGEGTMAALLKLAIDKSVPVEALEKLVTLNERIADRNAAQEFNAALASFQQVCPPIQRTSSAKIATNSGAAFSYKYAELDEIAKTIGPHLHAKGLSYSWDSAVDKNILRCVCTLRHANGHSITASFECPTDTKAGMTEAQKYAAALTFARRMSLVSVLGLTNTDPDTDGAAQSFEKITEHQAADLAALVQEVGADRVRFLKWLGVARMEDIPAAHFERAVRELERKRK